MAQHVAEHTLRVGIFGTVAQADRAVHDLQSAGFSKDQLGVMCSEKCKEQFFPGLLEPAAAGARAPQSVAAGGLIGASIGGLALAASSLVTGGATLLAAGAVLVGGGALAGTFAGLMATFGFENDQADYYEQALQQGKILVTVKDEGENSAMRLREADRILAEAGAFQVGKVRD